VSDPRLAPFRLPALAFAGFLVVQAVSAAALFALKVGPGPGHVRAFYLGNEASFTAPKSLAGLLEVAVPHLVAIPLVLFAVIHVVGFARAVGPRVFRLLVVLSFGSALLAILAGFGVRYLAPALAWAKIAAFVGLEAALLSWAALLAVLFIPSLAASRTSRTRRAEEVVS
jgi:hypothetical protein